MGACMQSVFNAFLCQHLLNVAGVWLVYYMSKLFLKETIKNSERMQFHLNSLDEQARDMGSESSLMFMISLRMFPGSPNAVYNYVFPHIPSLSLRNILVSTFIGQAPQNFLMA